MLREGASAPSIVWDMARVWYRHVSVLLIRRRRPAGEPNDPNDPSDAAVAHVAPVAPVFQAIDGTAGAGRICAALLELGVRLAGLRQAVIDAAAPAEALGTIDLQETFDRVVLGSHLVNGPEPQRRRAFLDVAARHLADGGTLTLEHHPLDWAETAEDVEPTPGSALGMVKVKRDPPFVSAVSVFDAFGRVVRQPFTARVLSEAELADELAAVGLAVSRRLGPTWLEARTAIRERPPPTS
jgi:hypothetical protein